MSQLPQGWSEVRLDSISKIVTGKTPSKKDKDNFGGNIPFVKPGDILNQGYINSTVETITEKGAELVPSIPKDSITVTCIGNLGRVAITKEKSATNQQINTAIPNEKVEPKYLFHYLRTIREWMENEASATTVAIINKTKFSAAPIRLPSSKADQKRIADKLDSVLAKVEVAQARLDKIPTILKRFRQSVLAAATSGELTKDWREENDVTGIMSDEGYPLSWQLLTIDDIAEVKGGKRLPKGEELVDVDTGYPYIRAGQLKNGTVINGNDARNKQMFISEDVHKQIQRYTVDEGDAYITIVGASIGDAGVIPQSSSGANLTENAAKLTCFKKSLSSDFLSFWLRSEKLQSLIKLEIKSGAQGKLALKRIKTLPIPYPNIDEQREIVRRVEELLANSDTVEKQYKAAKARLDKLTQSILAKAFRGELVK